MSMAFNVRGLLLTPALGPLPKAMEEWASWVGVKAPKPELAAEERVAMATTLEVMKAAQGEVEGPEVEEEKSIPLTIFPRFESGLPYIWDYQLRGFFKEAAGALRRTAVKVPKGEKAQRITPFLSESISAHKKVVDGCCFVAPRQIALKLPGDPLKFEPKVCIRPLRSQGPSGERVALVASEEVPAGTTFEYTVIVTDDNLVPTVHEWLAYGALKGLLQWRNSGRGTFTTRVSDPVPISLAQAQKLLHREALNNLPEDFVRPVLPPVFSD